MLQDDPVISILRYAYSVAPMYALGDMEAAIYAAAFLLYGEQNYLEVAAEAAQYNARRSGTYLDVLVDAHKSRMAEGTLYSFRTSE